MSLRLAGPDIAAGAATTAGDRPVLPASAEVMGFVVESIATDVQAKLEEAGER